jgi:pantoate--beta-alanine ligase
MSSRNVYLSAEERVVAPVLHESLVRGARLIEAGEQDAAAVRTAMADLIGSAPLGVLDYVEVADPVTLQPLGTATPQARLFGAIRFGRARLIDNVDASVAATGREG